MKNDVRIAAKKKADVESGAIMEKHMENSKRDNPVVNVRSVTSEKQAKYAKTIDEKIKTPVKPVAKKAR